MNILRNICFCGHLVDMIFFEETHCIRIDLRVLAPGLRQRYPVANDSLLRISEKTNVAKRNCGLSYATLTSTHPLFYNRQTGSKLCGTFFALYIGEWRLAPQPRGPDLYRYFDATPQTEYLYSCIEKNLNKDFKAGLRFVQFFDRAMEKTGEIVDMPTNKVSLLVRLIRQNNGTLSKSKRGQFPKLADEEKNG